MKHKNNSSIRESEGRQQGYGWTNLKKIEIIAMSHGFSVVGGGGGRERMIKSAITSTSGGVCLFSDCKTMTVVLQNLKIAFGQILLQLLGKLLPNK